MLFSFILWVSGEHLWPRSYGLVSGPSLTDVHNIRPADVNGNMSFSSGYVCGLIDLNLHIIIIIIIDSSVNIICSEFLKGKQVLWRMPC